MTAPNLDARDVHLVRAIVEAGGATGAAKRLNLSQSAVSHQLRGLEDRLGVKLFERLGKRLQVTEAGTRLVEVGQQVLAPLLQLELELKRSALKHRPKLRLGTQCNTAYHWLPKVLTTLMKEHAEVDLMLAGDAVGDANSALASGQLDLVLSVAGTVHSRFKQVPLFRDELVLIVPRGHALASKKYVEGQDLVNETLIIGNTSSVERRRVSKLVFGPRTAPARVLRVSVVEAIFELVHAGMGVSIQPTFALSGRLSRGELTAVPLTRTGIKRNWAGVFAKTSPLTAPIMTLLTALKDQAAR